MKVISLALIFVLLASAQQTAVQTPQTAANGVVKFQASTQLVIETVTVKDKNGKPVEGLTAKDFTITEDGARFAAPLGRDFKGVRVAWWKGLGGIPFEPEIVRVVNATRSVFEQLGCIVEEAEPDFSGVDEAFPTLRHLSYHSSYSALAKQRPEWIKDTIHWEINEAERQSAADVARASARQAKAYADAHQFFSRRCLRMAAA